MINIIKTDLLFVIIEQGGGSIGLIKWETDNEQKNMRRDCNEKEI